MISAESSGGFSISNHILKNVAFARSFIGTNIADTGLSLSQLKQAVYACWG